MAGRAILAHPDAARLQGPDGEPVFEPQVLEIEPGTTVRFEWDSGGHNLAVVGQPDEEEMIGVIIVGNPGPW